MKKAAQCVRGNECKSHRGRIKALLERSRDTASQLREGDESAKDFVR